MPPAKAILIWLAVLAAMSLPLFIAATSPLLQWRQPIYIVAGLAGVVALILLFVQPLLAAGALPGLPAQRGRRLHRGFGVVLVGLVALHVAGLWITSPPDVIDALLLRSPTPFSLWGVLAMWGLFAAATLALLRHRLPRPLWRLGHSTLTLCVVLTTAIHALTIEGTMGAVSKAVLCALAIAASLWAVTQLKSWRHLRRKLR